MEPKDRLPPATSVLLHQEYDRTVDPKSPPLPIAQWLTQEIRLSSGLIKNAEDLIAAKDPSAAIGAILIADQALARLWVRTEGAAKQDILLGHARTLRALYIRADALENEMLREALQNSEPAFLPLPTINPCPACKDLKDSSLGALRCPICDERGLRE